MKEYPTPGEERARTNFYILLQWNYTKESFQTMWSWMWTKILADRRRRGSAHLYTPYSPPPSPSNSYVYQKHFRLQSLSTFAFSYVVARNIIPLQNLQNAFRSADLWSLFSWLNFQTISEISKRVSAGSPKLNSWPVSNSSCGEFHVTEGKLIDVRPLYRTVLITVNRCPPKIFSSSWPPHRFLSHSLWV